MHVVHGFVLVVEVCRVQFLAAVSRGRHRECGDVHSCDNMSHCTVHARPTTGQPEEDARKAAGLGFRVRV